MSACPTADQLQAALARIRALPRCADWPNSVHEVLADPVRSRLLRLVAAQALRPAAACPPARPARAWRPPQHPAGALPAIDRKRAASGERDD